MTEPTWPQLTSAEPRLAELETQIIQHTAEQTAALLTYPNTTYCANAAWYRPDGYKAQMSKLVGWSALILDSYTQPPPADGFAYHGAELLDLADPPTDTDHPHYDLLRSSDAYHTAYHHLYNLLPDCRHEPTLVCGERQ